VHNNYYFLRQLTTELADILIGTVISECFSQNRDELIIRFETHAAPFFMRAALASNFSSLSFPDNFQRAKKNSIDLFPEMIGYRVAGIRQYTDERSFALMLEERKTLLFKMHGNRSNVILFDHGAITSLFKNNAPADQHIQLDSLDRHINWTYEAFASSTERPETCYFTFGKVVWAWLEKEGYNQQDLTGKWDLISKALSLFESPTYYLSKLKNNIHLTLLPFEDSRILTGGAIAAANEFYFAFTHEFVLEKEKASFVATLKSKLASSHNYYDKNFHKLAEIESDTNYKVWADLLMANMHQVKQGMEKVVLNDFYQPEKQVEIKLKKELQPQSNAAIYYKKAKNQHIEIDRIQQSLKAKELEIEKLKQSIQEIEAITDLKALRQMVRALGIQKEFGKETVSVPYHEFTHNGFRILVGKSAQGNDELTFGYGYKEDLWLHAKDVAGSHVLVKYQSGKKFPKDVIERAAELAAYNSKRKTETLCPVIVTPKKFVRKRKGDPAGAVVVEREDIVMATPKL
jgi:predicted ribosome quality control (RQC) complex YloA/Tae2 family protein